MNKNLGGGSSPSPADMKKNPWLSGNLRRGLGEKVFGGNQLSVKMRENHKQIPRAVEIVPGAKNRVL